MTEEYIEQYMDDLSEKQKALKARFGTPEEFAEACHKAVPWAGSVDEAIDAAALYRKEWDEASQETTKERRMFAGPVGKKVMIEQGYVPTTCTIPDEIAGLIIYAEVSAGRSPCDSCNEDRSMCGGKPKDPGYRNDFMATHEETSQ